MILFNGQLRKQKVEWIDNVFKNNYAYEVIRLIQKQPLFLEAHYNRLVKTCVSMNIMPPKLNRIEKDIEVLVFNNQIQNKNIKIAIDITNFAIYSVPSNYPSKEDYLNGVSCSLLLEEREKPEIKAYQADLREKANKQISKNEIFESVLVDRKGLITEGSRSNLFFIKGEQVITAPDHLVLAGITRMKVLEICKELKWNISYKAISTNELHDIDAAFICGTSPGVLPIARIESHYFDSQNPVLISIHKAFHSKYLLNYPY
jgi:branched-chain amino acid aminotransferase